MGFELINELNQKCIDLDNKVANLANLGRSLADAENKYKIALAQESLKLKENKIEEADYITLEFDLLFKKVFGDEKNKDILEKLIEDRKNSPSKN